jgi:general secretion pathway protein D
MHEVPFRSVKLSTVRCLILICLLAVQVWAGESALTRAARRAERSGDSLSAFLLYRRAASADPGDRLAQLRSQALEARLQTTAFTVTGLDPANGAERMANRITLEGISASDAIEGEAALPAPHLARSSVRKSFDVRGTVRSVIEEVARSFQIETIFEPDFNSPVTVTFKTGELERDEAFRVLEAVTNTFFVPVREATVLIFPDTQDQRNRHVSVIAKIVPIPERMSIQEAQELASGVQQIFELRHIAVDAGRHLIFMRDQEYKVEAARQMIRGLSRYKAQVAVDIELLSVSRTSTLNLGLNLQDLASITNLGGTMNLAQLARLSGSGFGIGVAGAQAFATLSRGSAYASIHAQLTASDGQQAVLNIGDRYPIVAGVSGFGDTSVPIVQFQDLGIKLQVTPSMHANGDVTLQIEGDYNALGGGFNNGIPIISGRKFQASVRAGRDQWIVVGGMNVEQHSVSSSGVAGLASLPWIGRLFRRETRVDDDSQVLIVLRPRVVSEGGWADPAPAFWIGTETKPITVF